MKKATGRRIAACGWICSSCHRRLASSSVQTRITTKRKARLPDAPAKTRFAPSPTGNLHLGSIRTALFNYLLARRTKGQFLLRVEDTDQKRTIPGAEDQLYRDLDWIGLQWDEGPRVGGPCGPYRQSERTAIYQSHVQPLLDSGHAYRCFCSSERLDNLNKTRNDAGLPLGYDRRCLEISKAQSDERAHRGYNHVIRFKAPENFPKYNDFVYGKTGRGSTGNQKLHVDSPVYEDAILIKSDGHPTYHFANVVDDHLMEITHVIRGSEWISSTPLHVALYEAFGWKPPVFGHVPLLVDEKGAKLSKRSFNSDISDFRDSGIFPDSLVNFVALLGWSHQLGNDVMTLQGLEILFDLKFTKGNTIVSLAKLDFLQQQHAKRYITERAPLFEVMVSSVTAVIKRLYNEQKIESLLRGRRLEDVVALMLQAGANSYTTPMAFAAKNSFFFNPLPSTLTFDPPDHFPLRTLQTAAAALCLTPLEAWVAEVHRQNLAALQFTSLGEGVDGKMLSKLWKKDFYHFLRQALLGGISGPSIPESMEILGRDICTERIRASGLAIKSQELFHAKPEIKTTTAAP